MRRWESGVLDCEGGFGFEFEFEFECEEEESESEEILNSKHSSWVSRPRTARREESAGWRILSIGDSLRMKRSVGMNFESWERGSVCDW